MQVNGHATPLAKVEFALMQATDYLGRPSSTVRIQPLRLTFTGQAVALAFFAQWGLDSFLRRSGRVVFYGAQNQVLRTITFFEAHCVLYHAALHPDVQGQAALTLALSPAAIDHQGLHVESHSLLPWAAPAVTRRRVLTSPADLLPSPHLRAAAQAAADAQAAVAPLFKTRRRLEQEEDENADKLTDKEQLRVVKQALQSLEQSLSARKLTLTRWSEAD